MKLKIISTRRFTYPTQTTQQELFLEIYQNGTIEVDVNPEIGNSVPSKVWHREILRCGIPSGMTRSDIKEFYRANKSLFAIIVKGFTSEWNGSNHVGVLTDEAQEALEEIEYKLYSF